MIGLTITFSEGSTETFNPMIASSEHVIDVEIISGTIMTAAVSIAEQLNNHISALDVANIETIVLNLNGSNVTYRQPLTE